MFEQVPAEEGAQVFAKSFDGEGVVSLYKALRGGID